MTLDEAIKHCEEVVKQHTRYNIYGGFECCDECADDHRQLAEWLTELKERRELMRNQKNERDKTANYKELCEQMKTLLDVWDVEEAHGKADDILCEALRQLGYNELVDLYEKVDKWYS